MEHTPVFPLSNINNIFLQEYSDIDVKNISIENNSFEIELSNDKATISDIIKKIVNAGGKLISCSQKEISLQDIIKDVVEQG